MMGLIILFIGLGMIRLCQARDLPDNHVGNWNDQKVKLTGTIAAEPEELAARTKLIVAVEQAEGEAAAGKVLVLVPRYPTYEYGQKIEFGGKLQAPENFAEFDYQNYLARYGIYSTMYEPAIEVIGRGGNPVLAALLVAKKYLAQSLQKTVPEPEAGFALGILLGQKSAVGELTQSAFRDSGTMHVMAVSGYNITIVATLMISATKWAGRRWSFFIAVIGITAFVLITGAQASVVRAALMGGLVLLAQQSGRTSGVRNVLVATAVIMVAINPLVLRFDIGFQLSFMAVLGLVYVGPLLEKYLIKVPKVLMLRESLTATLSANAMTFPISLVYFGQVSPLAPIINVILLPSIPMAMTASFIVALAGLVAVPLGEIASYPAWLILTYGIRVVKWGASLPGVSMQIAGEGRWLVLAVYMVIVISVLAWEMMKKQSREKK